MAKRGGVAEMAQLSAMIRGLDSNTPVCIPEGQLLEYQRRSGTQLGWAPVTAGMIFERELAVMGEDLPMLKWLLGKAGVDLKALAEAEDLDDDDE